MQEGAALPVPSAGLSTEGTYLIAASAAASAAAAPGKQRKGGKAAVLKIQQ